MKSFCKICLNKERNEVLEVKEMMFQFPNKFNYLYCSKCECLSLVNSPKDMSQYYPNEYYSYNVKNSQFKKFKFFKNIINKSAMKAKLGYGNVFENILYKFKSISFNWLLSNMVNLKSKILDVGCGNGFLIAEMNDYGFKDLTGIDPFLSKLATTDKSPRLLSTALVDFQENNFDMIMYHHSFEHLQFPNLELVNLHAKLKDDGILLIRVPVCDSFAFRTYKQNWVQLDAPRHYFLFSEKSMRHLAEKSGFKVEKIIYDSNSFQFTGSECYMQGKLLLEQGKLFTQEEINEFEKKAKILNEQSDGDSACFYLKKIT